MIYTVYIGKFNTLKELYDYADLHKEDGVIHHASQNFNDKKYELYFTVNDPYDDDHYPCCGCCEYMYCLFDDCWCQAIKVDGYDGNCKDITNDFGKTCSKFRLGL